MNRQLIETLVSPEEFHPLLREIIQAKIRYHESRIGANDSEEDIAMRERRITQLQDMLEDVRRESANKEKGIRLRAEWMW
ncbi:MAG: hypothetical protein LPK80_03495 [Bacteroidota bacterium]|nr:hypothetical protein [Bacteroidota bacterium]MDX5426954.1 hypothetical protein [Bacteroidota bacterium]MDX5447305.1 hypothetical protein [Bacteroidota bacterium]MDX5504942.1 hypothetical protein [Bacteroidota bacterium]